MAYPKNDTDFVEGVVTYVKDEGKMLKVGHKVNWWRGPYEGCSMQPKPGFDIKPGMKFREYGFMGVISRGVYIAGRVVRPYLTTEQAHEKARKFAEQDLAHYLKKKNINISRTKMIRAAFSFNCLMYSIKRFKLKRC